MREWTRREPVSTPLYNRDWENESGHDIAILGISTRSSYVNLRAVYFSPGMHFARRSTEKNRTLTWATNCVNCLLSFRPRNHIFFAMFRSTSQFLIYTIRIHKGNRFSECAVVDFFRSNTLKSTIIPWQSSWWMM